LINSVIARAAYQAEIDATIELIRDQQEQIALAETQSASGTVAFAAVLSLRSQLATLQASLPPLQQKLAQSESLLSTLAGHPPAEWQAPMITLADLTLPTDLPVSLPSNLVEQRPDILAASAVAHAASAAIGVATAAMLPNLNLTGTLGGNSNQTNSLLAARSQYWSFGASAAAPVFDGFTLWYQRKAAIETYQQAIALYRQTVLAAFAQVADSLRALDHDAATLQAEDLALDSALQARHLIAANYQAGLLPYLDLLTANQLVEQSRIARLQAVALRYQDGVALFAALGGGWWTDFTANRRDPSTD
jgi:NodT family efflux transporter outer membrane factor (OMF) lipoprotein